MGQGAQYILCLEAMYGANADVLLWLTQGMRTVLRTGRSRIRRAATRWFGQQDHKVFLRGCRYSACHIEARIRGIG